MKNFLKSLFISAMLIFAAAALHAQTQLDMANELYDMNQFEDAARAYLRIIEKNQEGKEQAAERLAGCYRFMGNKQEAEKWYIEAIKYPDVSSRAYLNYGVVLRDLGKYAAAKEQFLVYASQAPGDVRGNLYASYMDQLIGLTGKGDDEKGQDVIAVSAGDINTEFAELGLVLNGVNSAVFSSTRPTDPKKKRRMAEPMKLWQAEVNVASGSPTFAEPKLLLPVTRANADLVQGPASFTADGKTMFYTQSFSAPPNQYGDIYNGFEIVYSKFDGKEWSKPTSFQYNGKDYTNAHPTISADGTMLIFSSDMSGGYGATDLYVSRLNGDRWEKPRNLGANVNTADVENYPVLVNDTVLYFSSNGHMTFGGQDIVKSVYRDGAWAKAENMGTPINSIDDDICFFPLRGEELALLSSSRAGGKGENDIWLLSSAEPVVAPAAIPAPAASPVLSGMVEVWGTGAQLKILLSDDKGESAMLTADDNGTYTALVKQGQTYMVKAWADGFTSDSLTVAVKDDAQDTITVRALMVKSQPAPVTTVAEAKEEEPKEEPKVEEPVPVVATPAPVPTPAPIPVPVEEVKKEEPKPEPVAEPKKEEPAPVVEPKKEEAKPAPVPAPVAQPEYKSEEGLPLKSIYYDKNSVYPAKKSYGAIAVLLAVLKDNPNISVHFDAFSDAQGSEDVNLKISQGRAKTLIAYMQKQGIAAGRMTSAAYGDTKPVNHCKPAVQCTDEEHAKNRRVEVILRSAQAGSAPQVASQEQAAVESHIVSSVSSDVEAQANQGEVRRFNNISYEKSSIYPGPVNYANIGNLIVFMDENPQAVVELDAYSDAQGSESISVKIAQERARILSNYLQQNGVEEDRIVLRSHGSTRPLNRCSVGVSCTEAEHSVNRRVEVRVK